MTLTPLTLTLALLAAFMVGFSKTGVTGLGILIVPLMAQIWGAKESVGALLPMLAFADLFAVGYYRRHAQWPLLARLLPWVMPGLAAGYFALKYIPKQAFGPFLGGMVLVMIGLTQARRWGGEWLDQHLPHQWWFSALMGFLAGFATMVGNVAGPIMSVYLISMGLKKRQFMGTGAYYYLIVNVLKIPLQVSLHNITGASLLFDLGATPLIAVGALVGILVFNKLPQLWFYRAVLALAALGAAWMLVR